MEKVWQIILTIGLILLPEVSLVSQAQAAPTDSPITIVKDTIDAVVKIVEKYKGDARRVERREKIRSIINPHFDFAEMAKRSLGSAWKTVTPEEQKEFVDVFSNLLARTYLDRIENITIANVNVKSEDIEGDKAVVKSLIENKGDQFPLDYKFILKSNGWQVYDVVIENIGLVANYRNEFAGILRKEKFEGLMKKLREKSASEK